MLRANSLLNVGRSHDYKSDGVSLHIGDLKVPKKYITITTGPSELEVLDKTKLTIRFDSICTTTVNDVVYKLPQKEAHPISQSFDADRLVLKVNANKSDRIQLHLVWKPVQLLVFSKRIQYEGQIQPSPLPGIIRDLHSEGLDLRTVTDPLIATHYVTMSDFVDYNLQIAVLCGIPVVSTKWIEVLENAPDNVATWLSPPKDLLLAGTKGDFAFPNHLRRLLLAGTHCLIYYEGTPLKHVRRLQSWLECLGCASVAIIDVKKLTREALSMFGLSSVYLFTCIDEPLTEAFKVRANNTSDLWRAVVDVDIVNLKVSTSADIFPEPTVKEEPDSLRLTQRRKRRRVERVNDTDFFLFSQVSSQPAADSLNLAVNSAENEKELEKSQLSHRENSSVAESSEQSKVSELQEQYPEDVLEVPEVKATQLTDSKNSHKEQSVEPVTEPLYGETSVEVEQSISIQDDREQRKAEIEAGTENIEPIPKKQKKEARWIVPRVSLADAVLSTKKQADVEARKDFEFDDIGSQFEKLVVVEEIDLSRRKESVPLESIALYKGRKNFKKFKKNGPLTHSFTRKFLELEDDNNEIHFSDIPAALKEPIVAEKIRVDFAQEMDSVKGYQPSQLFVAEDDEDEENDETTFSFLASSKVSVRAPAEESDDDDDDDFAFKFSRA